MYVIDTLLSKTNAIETKSAFEISPGNQEYDMCIFGGKMQQMKTRWHFHKSTPTGFQSIFVRVAVISFPEGRTTSSERKVLHAKPKAGERPPPRRKPVTLTSLGNIYYNQMARQKKRRIYSSYARRQERHGCWSQNLQIVFAFM